MMVDTLSFLAEVWDRQAKENGQKFVFLSLRKDDHSWLDLAFRYGVDQVVVPDARLGDVYFCPNMFRLPRRRKELVLPSCWLYADMDTVVPVQSGAELSPSIAWESSEGRYQALWHVDKWLDAEKHSWLNQKLTYALGADKGGWDLTQVLRLPGTINHKYPKKPKVKLLWA